MMRLLVAQPEGLFPLFLREFISFLFDFSNISEFFALHGRVTFLYLSKETHQKNIKDTPCVGLQLLCALQSEPGAVNSGYALRHAPHLSGPAFQCSTTHKGMDGSKPKDQKQKAISHRICFDLLTNCIALLRGIQTKI